MAATSGIGAVNFSGLASGIDTSKIVEQLVAVDSQPLTRLQAQQTDLNLKKDTYTTMKSDLLTLQDNVNNLKSSSAYGVFSASSSDEEALTLSATTSAKEGNYRIKILSLAQVEALSSNSYTASDSALGLSGEILVNGKGVRIDASNTLANISDNINSLNNSVRASILKVSDADYRLIISAASQGEDGFQIANAGSQDVLGALGVTDGTKSIRETSDGKVLSSGFNSAATTIGSLTGIYSNAQGTVKVRNNSVSINLATDTLSSIRDKINALGINGVVASVESTTKNNATTYQLSITGTQDLTDSGNVLESLGILSGGSSGVKAKFQTNDLTPLSAKKDVKETTNLTDLGAKTGETVAITGTNADGTAVSRDVQISRQTRISDLLTEIQTAFSGNVTAKLENGRITIESASGGESPLAVKIQANGTLGGTLDFGSMSNSQVGRERLVSEGKNAKILVNNVTVSRSSNAISDALEGISLTLKKADPATELVVTVERNTDGIKTKISDFVKAYNDLVDFIDSNSQFDQEKKTAGPLLGDSTSRSVLSQIRSTLQGTVNGDGFTYTQLLQIGVETTSDGHLKIDDSKLDEALKSNVESVVSLLSATRSSSNSDLSFVYNSTKTKPGTYAVEISRAAEKASVSSASVVNNTASAGKLTITDNFGSSMTVDYSAGATPTDITNSINTEARKKYAEIIQSSKALKSSTGDTVTGNTAIGDIQGVSAKSGNSITITGTDHSGRSLQRRIVLGDSQSTTVQDVLTAIERLADSNISASIDAEGKIRVQDKTEGTSKLNLSISTTVTGLDFGSFSSIQKGRNTVTAGASTTSDNRLVLTHTGYGASNTFTVSGGKGLGIADGTYQGKDVAGTINGVAGTGNGQSLTAASSDASSTGIVIRSSLRPEDLAIPGKSKGTVTLISGVADVLYRQISSFTATIGGFVQSKIDSFGRSLNTLQNNINDTQKRVDQRKEMYTAKYAKLEQSLSMLQSMQSQLSASLSSLPATRL